MEFPRITGAESKRGGPRFSPVAILIVLFWLGQFCFLTLQRHLYGMGMSDGFLALVPRFGMSCAGMAVSFAIDRVLRRQNGRSWPRRVTVAILAAVCGMILHAAANYTLFQLVIPEARQNSFSAATLAGAMVAWLWMYSAISALLLAGAYSDELRERERRLAEWQELAHSAQMRALRYQLNPHFMFNTLNSIASLIASGNAADAEQMVENLADFLRAGLALDPNDDLTLERELELQSLYLAIEAIRFADRLQVEMALPEALRDVRVPSLILQPLVENAVKHGVARSNGPVRVAVTARQEGDRLHLMVRNGVGGAPGKTEGTGIGLINAVRRLELRYGEECDFRAGLEDAHNFVVSFSIPLQRGE
jgi:two-component system, LytTR family, sensor kinase